MKENDLTTRFEAEVRFPIEDISVFKDTLSRLGGRLIYPYHEIDDYYVPSSTTWDPFSKNLRIRKWLDKRRDTEIYYAEWEFIEIEDLKFKRSTFEDGKIEIYKGNFKNCQRLVSGLGFKPWISIEKRAEYWDISEESFKIAFETIESKTYGEIEVDGTNYDEARDELIRIANLLNLDYGELDYRPMSCIVSSTTD